MNLRVLVLQSLQIALKEDILLVNIREDEVDLCLIALTPSTDDCSDDLQHRRDTCSTGNHAESPHHVRCVHHRAFRSLDFHHIADLERCQVSADVACRVGLDEEIEVAGLMVAADGCI